MTGGLHGYPFSLEGSLSPKWTLTFYMHSMGWNARTFIEAKKNIAELLRFHVFVLVIVFVVVVFVGLVVFFLFFLLLVVFCLFCLFVGLFFFVVVVVVVFVGLVAFDFVMLPHRLGR
ncbi:unnamed protein product [Polarella glacialis]|uniref:Uncharacterized protein n=1 Tax=Polarella glacialis TaxID=89957 RepID=A0A813HAD1_POLGL|nr:unnamed protein product [Polarella glacialis]